MANLLFDFAKGFASNVAPDSLQELKSDADTIRDTIMGGAKTAQDKYREIRQSPTFKKATDWFFRRGSDFESGSTLEDGDDDFDAGFNFGGDDQSSKKETSLDYEGMRNIVKGQVSSMYQIAGKQAEATAMNTSEIITSLNTRSSEILSSLSNVNTTLKEISGKLDKVIQLQTGSDSSSNKNKTLSLLDSSGNISLSSFFNALKQGASNNQYVQMASMVPTILGLFGTMGSMGASKAESFGSITGMAMSMFGENIKIGTGDNKRSIADIKEAFDNKIHNSMNNLFSKILNWDKFKKLFGDLTKREADKDYSAYVDNKYDRKKAIFDNMTRKTIVDIIPAYLRKITAALTGETYFIGSDGGLTTDRPSGFTNVFNNTLQSGLNSNRIKTIMKDAGANITREDVDMAQRILTSLYVFQALKEGIRVNSGDDFINGGDPAINARAVDILSSHGQKKPKSYWENVITLITSQFITSKSARDHFARVVRTAAESTDKRAVNYAENATSILDIGKIDDKMIETVVGGYADRASGIDDRTYAERIKAGEMKKSDIPAGASENDRPSEKALEQARRERIKQAELVGNIGKSFRDISSTTIDYVASIFHLLNRGINVYNMQRQGPFEKMTLVRASASTSSSTTSTMTYTTQATAPTVTTTVSNGTTDSSGSAGTEGGSNPETQSEQSVLDRGVNAAKNLFSNPFNAAKNFVSSEWEKMKADAANAKNEASIKFNSELAAGQLRNDDTISEQDKQTAAAVLSAMQTGAADGETAEDMAQLMEQISTIENPKLKSRLTNVVQGTMKRAEVKKPAQSKIGKILIWGWGFVKKFIGGALSKAKTFITTIGKKFLSPLLKSLGKNIQGIKSGAVAIKEGIFGSEESLGLVGRAKERFSRNKGESGEETQQQQSQQQQQQQVQQQQQQVQQQQQQQMQQMQQMQEQNTSMMSKLKDKINDSAAVKWFKNTEFGEGFMSAFQKPKELKEETVADKETKNINEILNNKQGVGVFGTIIDSIAGVTNAVDNAIEKITNPKSGEGSTAPSITTDGQPVTDTQSSGEESGGGGSVELPTPSAGGGDSSGGAAAATGGDASASGAAGGKTKGIGFDFGKILGGVFSIGGNIVAAIIKVITSLKAFKAMMAMFNKALTKILKPLNKAFKALSKALKPVLKTVTKVLKQIVEYVVEIVESVINIIQPIIESIGPLIEQIFKVLEPLLKIITDVVNGILAPVMGILNKILVPVIKGIASTLEIVSGIVEVGFGLVLTVLGGVYTVVGGIKKFLTFGFGDTQYKMGKQMMQTGTQLLSDGKSKLKSGFSSFANILEPTEDVEDTSDFDYLRGNAPKREALNTGSPMDGIYGSGDASVYDSIYGGYGVNQGRYGNFMNMTQRGCGPVALADAYARRSGGAISATGLTSAMASAGSYSPSMGTSVSGFMRTAGAMGMGLTPGGVTPASLKQASPRNPITIIGSGADFSTRGGNNHYMNVIGSSGGTAYVSNPLSGRIERRPISGLASSSVLGLYGSGNAPAMSRGGLDYLYGSGDVTEAFGEAIQDTLSSLKELVGGIIGLFTGDSDTEASVKKANAQAEYEQAMYNQGISSLSEAEGKFKTKALEYARKKYPKRAGESDTDYEKRINREYERNKASYLALAMNDDLHEKAKLAAGDGEGTLNGILNDSLGTDFVNSMDEMWEATKDADTLEDLFKRYSSGYVEPWEYKSGFYSDNGAPLITSSYKPTVFDNSDAVNWNYPDGNTAPNIPLMEWMSHYMPGIKGIAGAYEKMGPPANSEMIGSTGDSNDEAIFYGDAGTQFVLPFPGMLVGNTSAEETPSLGNTVIFRDWGNDFHVFSHLRDKSSEVVGKEYDGGEPIGYIGKDGLHWKIRQSETGSSGSIYNPYTFYKWYDKEEAAKLDPSGDATTSTGPVPKYTAFTEWMGDDLFTPHKSEFEASAFHDLAVKAGLTPEQEAYVAAIGLRKDGGKLLFGGDVTLVENNRFGLGNWATMSPNGSSNDYYGATLEDQLRIGFNQNYFQSNPTHTDAYITNVDRYQRALASVLGYDLKAGNGIQWGSYLNTDLLEGTGHGVGSALRPDWNYTYEQQLPLYGGYIGDAARYYNWLIEKGYVSNEGSGITSLGEVVDTSNKRYLTSDLTARWEDIYNQYLGATSSYFEEGSGYTAAAEDAYIAAQSNVDPSLGIPYSFTTTLIEQRPPSNLTGTARDQWRKAHPSNKVGDKGIAKNKAGTELFEYILLDENAYYNAKSINGINLDNPQYRRHSILPGGGSIYYYITKFKNVNAEEYNKLTLSSSYVDEMYKENMAARTSNQSQIYDSMAAAARRAAGVYTDEEKQQMMITTQSQIYSGMAENAINAGKLSDVYKMRKLASYASGYGMSQIPDYGHAVKLLNNMYIELKGPTGKTEYGGGWKVMDDGSVHYMDTNGIEWEYYVDDFGEIKCRAADLHNDDYWKYNYNDESWKNDSNDSGILNTIGQSDGVKILGGIIKGLDPTSSSSSRLIANGTAPSWSKMNYTTNNLSGSGDANPYGISSNISRGIMDIFSQTPADNSGGTIINSYNVTGSSNDIMEKLTSNTYNIRSEKIENMLTGMLTLMRERRQKSNNKPTRTAKTRSRNQNREGIFTDESIPRQIERLSIG